MACPCSISPSPEKPAKIPSRSDPKTLLVTQTAISGYWRSFLGPAMAQRGRNCLLRSRKGSAGRKKEPLSFLPGHRRKTERTLPGPAGSRWLNSAAGASPAGLLFGNPTFTGFPFLFPRVHKETVCKLAINKLF